MQPGLALNWTLSFLGPLSWNTGRSHLGPANYCLLSSACCRSIIILPVTTATPPHVSQAHLINQPRLSILQVPAHFYPQLFTLSVHKLKKPFFPPCSSPPLFSPLPSPPPLPVSLAFVVSFLLYLLSWSTAFSSSIPLLTLAQPSCSGFLKHFYFFTLS